MIALIVSNLHLDLWACVLQQSLLYCVKICKINDDDDDDDNDEYDSGGDNDDDDDYVENFKY